MVLPIINVSNTSARSPKTPGAPFRLTLELGASNPTLARSVFTVHVQDIDSSNEFLTVGKLRLVVGKTLHCAVQFVETVGRRAGWFEW
jgi:hypothetical protein